MASVVLTGTLALAAPMAQGGIRELYRDGDLLKCISLEVGVERVELYLDWDKSNRYEREVKGLRLNFPAQSCDRWQSVQIGFEQTPTLESIQRWQRLLPAVEQAELDREFAMIRKGGLSREFEDLRGWLAKEDLSRPFTIEDNRKAAHAHGIAFARDVYTQWTLAQPGNLDFRNEFRSYISSDFKKGAEDPSEFVILVARELGFSPKDGTGKLWPFIVDLRGFGYEVEAMPMTPYASVYDNSQVIQARLAHWASLGRKVVLVGASKGASDMLHALSAPTLSREAHKSVVAVINISGVVNGSIFADILDEHWMRGIFDGILRLTHLATPMQPVGDVDAFNDLRTRTITRLLAPAAAGALPQGAMYINVVGTPAQNGIAINESMQEMQLKYIKRFKDFYGANDGYVEFPCTEIPRAWTPRSQNYTIFLDSSHVLMDGGFEGQKMTNPRERRRFVGALMRSVLSRYLDGKLGSTAKAP